MFHYAFSVGDSRNTALCVNYIFIHFQIQDCITSLSCNDKGSLIISGGTDGKVCIWHWGRDEFLHRAGEIYITNLPIQSAKVKVNCIEMFQHENKAYKVAWKITYPSFQFNNPRDDEITVSISSHVMNLKVIKKSSQIYSMKQQPSVHIKMPGRYGISSPFSIGNIFHFSIN